jgi:hypothetical protein
VNENPLGVVIPEEPLGPKRRSVGPLMAGLIAIALAMRLYGLIGMIAAVFAVGSWWVYKYWPSPWAAGEPESQAFIDRLEGLKPDEIDAIPPEKPGPGGDILDIQI